MNIIAKLMAAGILMGAIQTTSSIAANTDADSSYYSKKDVLTLEAMRTHFRSSPVDATTKEAVALQKYISKGDGLNWIDYLLGPPHSKTIHLDHRTQYMWSSAGRWRLSIYIKDDFVDQTLFMIE